MASLSFTFTPDSTYTGNYNVVLYKTADLTTPISNQIYTPLYSSPITKTFTISDLDDYTVIAYAVLCSNKNVGQKAYTFPSTCQPPINPSQSALTSTTVTISWTDPDGIVTGIYDWEVYASDGTTLLQNGTVTANTVNITGLTTATTYVIRIYSQCAVGVDSSPASITITTS